MRNATESDRSGDRKRAFIQSLEADLGALGLDLGSLPDTPRAQLALADFHGRRIREQSYASRPTLANAPVASPVRPNRLRPTLHFCDSAADNRLYETTRLIQRIPSGRRIGRQVRILVYDSAQEEPALIGAIGLASPLYRLGCRDRYLDWAGSSKLSIRHSGLRRTMDLAVCVSTPAYSGLRVTKLLAMLALTSPVAERYASRYGEPLLAVVTTCGTGAHCACFNRIMIRPSGLFKKVGETAGYTTGHFSNATIRAARRLVLGTDGASDIMRSAAEALPVLRTALKRLELPHEKLLRMGVRKAVYIAECYPGSVTALRNADPAPKGQYLTIAEVVQFWSDRVVKVGQWAGRSGGLIGESDAVG